MDVIVQALQSFFSQYVVALAVLILAAVWGVWKLASAFQSMRDKVKKVDTLPCSHHGLRLNTHDGLFTETRATLGEMKGQLELLVKLSTASRTKPLLLATEEYSEKHSPRRLNQNGEILYNDISGEDFLSRNQTFFFSEIDKLKPKTALDVENFALSVLRAALPNDMFIPLKSWVYNAPTREIVKRDGGKAYTDVSMDDVLFVLSLPLRDKYLKVHPDIIQ